MVVTGSSGLVGSETVKFFHDKGFDVVGIDNNMRRYFFGEDGSVQWNTRLLQASLPRFQHHSIDVRDSEAVARIFAALRDDIFAVIHAAAQPSHDWAAKEPVTDFTINAQGTLVMLENVRHHCPDAVFVLLSTNKVYGDTPNRLPLIERETRWELDPAHPFARHGIDESMSIDQCTHSIFGVSKVAADVLTQEYGRYFGLSTGVFRGGCLTGPAHSGAELHGFLAYLVKCAVTGKSYTIFGYKGKQVRDNIHSSDLVGAIWEFTRNPVAGGVYNMGGSRHSNCSILEAIAIIERLLGREVHFQLSEQCRTGDHIWYVSDVRKFQQDFPDWRYQYRLEEILAEIVAATSERFPDS